MYNIYSVIIFMVPFMVYGIVRFQEFIDKRTNR